MSESSIHGLIQALIHPVRWIANGANRWRLRGARIEVIACVLCRNPTHSILLAKSPFHGIWSPPQEGVNLKETPEQALHRCLRVECGINLPVNPSHKSRALHFRSIKYVGHVPLTKERIGERPIADDVYGTWMESIKLRRKAYWMATILIAEQTDISPKPDGKEVLDFAWYSIPDARQIINETNRPGKARLLSRLLDACSQDMNGAPMN